MLQMHGSELQPFESVVVGAEALDSACRQRWIVAAYDCKVDDGDPMYRYC
jgi:hypothetical protein